VPVPAPVVPVVPVPLVAVSDEAIQPVTGDPEDDLVLATARLGQADYLVTRDKGLLNLGHHASVAILSPYDFVPHLPRDR